MLPKRVAIIHEWFTSMRGGEKCVEAMCEEFPQATLFTLLHVKGTVSPAIERMPIRTSVVQHLPFSAQRYRYYLPLFPAAIQQFDLSEFDCVISSHHCVAKGVRVPDHALHICYCYTPMRYVWGQYDDYFAPERAGILTRLGMRCAVGPLRRWDVRTAANPHHFVAISENVRGRISGIYGRQSDVIYPPVDMRQFSLSNRSEGWFLVVSALVPYKRVDLAIEACNRTGDRLVIVGDGPDMERLQSLAGPTVEFEGWQPDKRVKELYGKCSALLFPGEEDFGIVPLEAMASGKPVIAFGQGGALETVLDTPSQRTGVLFREQTVEALVGAIAEYRRSSFDAGALRDHAATFDREIFKRRVRDYVERRWRQFSEGSSQL
jgi:glycosyltransferase involved in cell wall biosynthesis